MSEVSDSSDDNRLVSPENNEHYDPALRPRKLDDFVGQGLGRRNLETFIAASAQRQDALDHTLLHGPPGLGKTTMAQIISAELGVGFRATSGPVIARAGDLAALLTNLAPRDVLFIDEIHRLNPAVEEILYPAMEDFQLDLIIGEGPSARSVRIDLPQFTLVGATTRAGLLTTPLRDRFGIQMRMQFYSDDELVNILSRQSKKLNVELASDGALEIARRARGTPRVAGRLLRRVRDIVAVDGDSIITKQAADSALLRLEVDERGLDQMDRRYLHCLVENYGGGPVGIETLAAVLAEQRDMLEEVIEPYMMQIGLLMRTPRGRCLSKSGWAYLQLDPPVEAARQLELLSQDHPVQDDA
ncbi:Holliday junction branch migration DNA helicase RuvB [Alphaproteobacteria bacterium]|jgi:holliday junction DNA helicase RuvB|nr:Holliday junction branch migration DNA helicase RuvB [Alphaproteobacteria bacterium]MDC0394494.1 Holliday junction branch migration DNA helicase RuvB [Alphaproteobacteria bacterium]MDC0462198.1 Holliday junction branch migration DNA helicase RuvB [Alphaproteobacteria bacterium]